MILLVSLRGRLFAAWKTCYIQRITISPWRRLVSMNKPRQLVRIEYEEAAERYLRSLPPEHFMEAVAQSTQRKITLESLDLVHARRADVQIFSELLVQYPLDGGRKSTRWSRTTWWWFMSSPSRPRAATTCHCNRSALSGFWSTFPSQPSARIMRRASPSMSAN